MDDTARTTKIAQLRYNARTAVEVRQIYSVFQPIVDLHSGEPIAHEALVRCEVQELASPQRLIESALADGCLGMLGREARRTAFKDCPAGALFVNVHPDEFDDGWLTRPDDPMFTHTDDVYIEITEDAPVERYRFAKTILTELRDRGIKLALDDFGAGYSNVMSIVELEPHIVKLDRSLVAGARMGTRQHTLLRSLVGLCADQGARVVAEGIETAAELDAVLAAGVHLAQGYYLGRPARG